jgi:hypothetical protein
MERSGMCAAEPMWHGSRIAERSHGAQLNVWSGATAQKKHCTKTVLYLEPSDMPCLRSRIAERSQYAAKL